MDFVTGTIRPIMRKFRLGRAKLIRSLYPDIEQMNVLDLGGSIHFWNVVGEVFEPRQLTILNVAGNRVATATPSKFPNRRVEYYDGLVIPHPDGDFDLVICNSVIEHVPLDRRAYLASEIRRVGKRYVVQTPAYEFPLEPHFVAPFIHWLPRRLGRKLARLTPRGLVSMKSRAAQIFDSTQLLKRGELAEYFPGGTLHVERFAGMPKSYLVSA